MAADDANHAINELILYNSRKQCVVRVD